MFWIVADTDIHIHKITILNDFKMARWKNMGEKEFLAREFRKKNKKRA